MSGAEENQKPGYIFELTADIGCGRNFTIRGNFPVEASAETMHKEMDKIVRVCDRQLSKAVIPAVEKKLRDEERTLETFKANTKLLKKQAEGHKAIPAQAAANIENAESNVRAQEANIEEQKKLLIRTKKDAE